MKNYIFMLATVFALVFSGCGGGGSSTADSGTPPVDNFSSSVEVRSDSSKIIAYEFEVHCSDNLPTVEDIQIDTTKLNSNNRETTVLGPIIDSDKNTIKVAVMSTGTGEGSHSISKAMKFNGCKDANVINVIGVDSSANKITDIETKIIL